MKKIIAGALIGGASLMGLGLGAGHAEAKIEPGDYVMQRLCRHLVRIRRHPHGNVLSKEDDTPRQPATLSHLQKLARTEIECGRAHLPHRNTQVPLTRVALQDDRITHL